MVETLCRSAAKGKSAAVQDAAARDGYGETLGRGAATMQPAVKGARLRRAPVRALVGPRPSLRRSSVWELAATVGSLPTVPMG